MNKDYISVLKSDGSTEQMEVVLTFRLEESKKDCIVYKSIIDKKFYAASYDSNNDYTKLNTDFTDEEKVQINNIFESLTMGDEIND